MKKRKYPPICSVLVQDFLNKEFLPKLEVIEHLKQTGIPLDSDGVPKIPSIFDFDLEGLFKEQRIEFIILDHNQLDKSIEKYES